MTIIKVSPSQVETAILCMRRWAFAHICHRWEDASRGTALGLRVHEIHENYLRDGVVPDPGETWIWKNDPKKKTFYPGRIALSMMPRGVYPAPRTGEVELSFTLEIGGVIWTGKIDWHRVESPFSIIIIDHKTSANPLEWAKTSDKLPTEPQALIYARALCEYYGHQDAMVTAHWNYGSNDASKKKALVSTAHFEPDETRERFERLILPIGRELVRLRRIKADPLTLPFNSDACFAFHKLCRFVDDCKLTNQERLGSIIMGNPLIDSLLEEAGAESAEPTESTAMPPKNEDDIVNPPDDPPNDSVDVPDDGPPLSDVDPPASSAPQVPLDDDGEEETPPPTKTTKKSTAKQPSKADLEQIAKQVVDEGTRQYAKAVNSAELLTQGLSDALLDKVAEKLADKIANKLFK